jgi:hypothetical protein
MGEKAKLEREKRRGERSETNGSPRLKGRFKGASAR